MIYLNPLFEKKETTFDEILSSEGRLVWQKYNCQSCHQLYGLGGYLGPDLTNVISQPNKGESYVRVMLMAGAKQMPKYNLSDSEVHALLSFLVSVDKSGKSDPRLFTKYKNGMISKNERL